MINLLAAGHDRELIIPPLRPIRVPPPPVRVALAVQSAAEASEDGAPGGREQQVLREACADWLPLRAFSVLFSEAFTPERRLQAIASLVTTGPQDLEAGEGSGDAVNWEAMVARYRSAYRCSVEEVLDEPWHRFISQLRQIGHLQAREQVRFIRAYTALRSSDGEDILEEIIEAADPNVDSSDEEDLTEEEKKERRRMRDKLVAESYQKRQHMLN